MDKTAARRKAKRRAEKDMELWQAKRKAYEGLKDFARDAGVKSKRVVNAGVNKVWKAHLEIEREFFVRAGVIANLAVLHALAFGFDYGRKKRLPEAFSAAVKGLGAVSRCERSAEQFNDEMRFQYGFDFYEFINEKFGIFQEDLLVKMRLSEREIAEIMALASRVPSMLIIGIYSMYFWIGLKKPSMMRLCSLATNAAIDMVRNNNFSAYQAELLKKTDINFTDTGMVEFNHSKR